MNEKTPLYFQEKSIVGTDSNEGRTLTLSIHLLITGSNLSIFSPFYSKSAKADCLMFLKEYPKWFSWGGSCVKSDFFFSPSCQSARKQSRGQRSEMITLCDIYDQLRCIFTVSYKLTVSLPSGISVWSFMLQNWVEILKIWIRLPRCPLHLKL